MLTKEQKKEHVALGGKLIKDSKGLIFADFSGVSVADLTNFKNQLREAGATFKVIKKRLLNLALKDAGIEFDPMSSKAPIGTIFSEGDITSIASTVYKFKREVKKQYDLNFDILGAFDPGQKKVLSTEEFMVIAKLPSKDVLLAMVAGTAIAPLRAFMYILQELAIKGGVTEEKKEEVKAEEKTKETKEEEINKEVEASEEKPEENKE